MLMKKVLLPSVLAIAAAVPSASAQFVINTAEPESVVHIGVRAGVNVSNTSSNEQGFMSDNIYMRIPHWKPGFSAGAVVDLRIRECFAIQPGVFYSTRAYGFDRCSITSPDKNTSTVNTTSADLTSRYIEVPILLSFRVNMSRNFQLQFDFGPYVEWGLGGKEKYTVTTYPSKNVQKIERDYFGDDNLSKKFNWGFKMGVGFEIDRHFYVGAHYMAGCRNMATLNSCTDPAAAQDLKAAVNLRNKSWQFTVGYNF